MNIQTYSPKLPQYNMDVDPIDSIPPVTDTAKLIRHVTRHMQRIELEEALFDACCKFQNSTTAHLTFPLSPYDVQQIALKGYNPVYEEHLSDCSVKQPCFHLTCSWLTAP